MNTGSRPESRLAAAALSFGLALSGLACREAPTLTDAPAAVELADTTPDASAADLVAEAASESDAGALPDAGPVPKPLSFVARAVSDAVSRELVPGETNDALDPQSRFDLELPFLADVRVRLFDESDRAVPCQDRMEVGSKVRYSLVPSEPLVTGSRYTLVIDGLKSELAKDRDGQPYKVVRVELRTDGEKPPPPSKPTKKRRSKRRK